MTSVTQSKFAQDFSTMLQDAESAGTDIDYTAVLKRITGDGRVSGTELRHLADGLRAEVAAGRIDLSRAKEIMGTIEAKALATGLKNEMDFRIATKNQGDLSVDMVERKANVAANKLDQDRDHLASDVRNLGGDGELSGSDVKQIWQDALGSDDSADTDDVSTIYTTLSSMLKAGSINADQYKAMRQSADAYLGAQAGASMAEGTQRYVADTITAHGITGAPTAAQTWTDTLDAMTDDLPKKTPLSAGTVSAFADAVMLSESPVTDASVLAVTTALNAAVTKGTISYDDAAAITSDLDAKIGEQRLGIAAKASFTLAGTQLIAPIAEEPDALVS